MCLFFANWKFICDIETRPIIKSGECQLLANHLGTACGVRFVCRATDEIFKTAESST